VFPAFAVIVFPISEESWISFPSAP
jgi:hypothetical protein